MGDDGLIHSRFERAARRAPHALALDAPEGEFSYAELDGLAQALAARLRQTPGEGGPLVAILAERGASLVIAMLACLKAARPFVVLDLAYPRARLAGLAAICRPGLALLAGQGAAEAAEQLGLGALEVALEQDGAAPAGPATAASPDDPAYLLFTSGSTGTPKCVAVSHRPLVHFLDWQARTFELSAADRFTLLSGLSHDPVLRDLFQPLSLGASLHVPPQEALTQPGALAAWFAKVRPTAAHMTPPLGQILTADRRVRLQGLRYVFFGGDVLRLELTRALAEIAPVCESVNFYGATETPQAASFHRARPDSAEDRIPIGRAVDGFQIDIVDSEGRSAPDGAVGEIVVRSRLLTLGPVEDGRLPGPPSGETTGSYSTGDLGRRRPDGAIMALGRRDDQVKVRGHRVELAEIAAAARKAPRVGQALALNVGEGEDVRICCFVGPEQGRRPIDAEALKAHLASSLPAYMQPHDLVLMDAPPLSPNGKIDRQALVAGRRRAAADARPAAQPRSAAEARLLEDWRRLFRRAEIDASASFASLGGDSLSYVGAYLSLEQVLGGVPEGWTVLSIAELARRAPAQTKAGGWLQEVETAMMLRAAAITAVVGSHFHIFDTGSGAVSALIWISGVLFGRLQLRQADEHRSIQPILRLLLSVLLPVFAIEAPQVLVKFLLHHHARFSSVFLYTDLLDYTGMPASGPNAYGGHEYLMWYVHCLIHILVAYAALLLVFTRGLKLKRPALAAAAAAFGLGLAGRFLLPSLVLPGFWQGPINPLSFFSHAPTTHLATFALAALTGLAGRRARLPLFLLSLAYAALGARSYGASDAGAIVLVAAALTFVPRLKLPRAIALPAYLAAGASLFIYLLHFKVLDVTSFLHLPVLAAWPLAVVGGVAAWQAWNFALHRAGPIWTALRGSLARAPRPFAQARAAAS